jgi:3-deoxy-D-manno-octulosonate 8-phosphate phosphatase (KDO 8-P phosphatase)
MRLPDMDFPPDSLERARRVKLLLFDVDGVLTDGRLLIDGDGRESKQYHIRDGTGLVWARQAGLLTGFLSARVSASTAVRARQLGVAIVRQGADDKLQAFREILAEHRLTEAETAYMGDDVLDLPVLESAGLAAAPADASPDVLQRVHWVSERRGGDGAARDLIERVLRAQGAWDDLVARYTGARAR